METHCFTSLGVLKCMETHCFTSRCVKVYGNPSLYLKFIYVCGDFNFDLLKIDSDHVTQHFFNLLCSFGLLPHVLQPTRVTDNTATLIDNIFSNNIQDNIVSGNILLTCLNTFLNFYQFTREKVYLKKVNIYQRDYSNFSSDSFRDDVSNQNWNYS